MNNKPQTVEEIMKEFDDLIQVDDYGKAKDGYLLRGYDDHEPYTYPETMYELDEDKVKDWIEEKLQSLQTEAEKEIFLIAQKHGIDLTTKQE